MLGERLQTLQNALKMGLRQSEFKPRDLNGELGFHMNLSLRIEKLSGKVILEKDSDLVTRHLMRIIQHLFSNYQSDYKLPTITITDVGGNARTGTPNNLGGVSCLRGSCGMYGDGNVGDGATGILIGSGTTSPTRTDYVLQTPIGTGSITHNAMSYAELNDYSFRLTREFTNALVPLNVSEAGMVNRVFIGTMPSSTAYNFLLARDVFTTIPISIGNGIRVRYTWSF